jgi:LPS export ABC transporter permease LptG
MGIVDRYVFREWLQSFLLTLGVVIGLLILQNMYDTLPDLLNQSASWSEIILYYAWALPVYIPATLPIILLVSVLLAVGSLHRNNEIIAMRVSGIHLFKISRSILVTGLICSLAMLYFTAYLVPQSVENSRALFDNLKYTAAEERAQNSDTIGLIYNLAYTNNQDHRLWFMNRFSERSWLGSGVTVHVRDSAGKERKRISAREAYFDDLKDHWVFVEGRELLFDTETGDPLRARTFHKEHFLQFDEDPGLMLALRKDPKELSLNELKKILSSITVEDTPQIQAYRMRYLSLLAAPFSCLIVVGIAIPFATSGVRTNPLVGVAKCLGLFLFFYVLTQISWILGERNYLHQWFAAWLPNIVLLLISINLFIKAR